MNPKFRYLQVQKKRLFSKLRIQTIGSVPLNGYRQTCPLREKALALPGRPHFIFLFFFAKLQ
jgi:hypothetical protein